MATLTWHAVEVPSCALELGQRVPLIRPPAESTRSRVNDSPCSARRARTNAESREAGTGVTLEVSGPASSPVHPAVARARGRRRKTDDEPVRIGHTLEVALVDDRSAAEG